MGLLVIGPEQLAEIERVRSYADQEENRYHPTPEEFTDRGASGNPKRPGNDPEHHYDCMLGTYHCIYSITETDQGVVKHLSVKNPRGAPHSAPNPIIVIEIAKAFGFTPDPRYWQMDIDDCRPACAVVIEPIEFKDQQTTAQWQALLASRGVS